MRTWTAVGLSLALSGGTVSGAAQPAQAETGSIVGAWTLNKDGSDAPRERASGGDRSRGQGGGGAGRGRGFGGGGGGGRRYGGGGGRGPGGGGQSAGDQEDARRRMQAMRDLMDAPERLTITETESLVIVTAGDGRTTRLSPDGKKIKDESTGLARKTKRENGTLVSEITGGPNKIIETYAVDQEHHQLTVTLKIDNSRLPNGGVVRHVYDPERAQ
jgi:hypothetical protein